MSAGHLLEAIEAFAVASRMSLSTMISWCIEEFATRTLTAASRDRVDVAAATATKASHDY